MNDYTIITDSSCDLPDSLVKELELEVLPLSFILDGKTYRNYQDCCGRPGGAVPRPEDFCG